jgi:hypothetical protein
LGEPLTLAEAIQDLLPHEPIAFCACCYCVSLDEAAFVIRDYAGSLKILVQRHSQDAATTINPRSVCAQSLTTGARLLQAY